MAIEVSAGRERVDVTLSQTVWDFVHSKANIVLLVGPRGEGKTCGGVFGVTTHAARHREARPIKVAVVRDTWKNLDRTCMETLRQCAMKGWIDIEWISGNTEAILNGGVAHLYFLGMDRPADANKFQGLELGMVWLEEPAPAADLASGVPADVLAMSISSLRQQGVSRRVQITMNPPDEDHWTMRMVENLEELDSPALTVQTFWIAPGENPHLPPGYRDAMRVGFEEQGRQDLVQRLVEGRVGSVTLGVSVAPEFSEELHVAKKAEDLEFGRHWPMFRFWDFGMNPTVVFATITEGRKYGDGHLWCLGCLVGDNLGLEQFIQIHVLPWQQAFGVLPPTIGTKGGWGLPMRGGYRFRDIGDPAGWQREQSNSDRSAALTLEAMLHTSFEAAPPDWPARRDSLRAVLSRNIGGTPMLQLDPQECRPLIRALRGGWHYPKDNAGKISDRPVKDMASHPGDALAYGCSVLFPVFDIVRRSTPQQPRPRGPEPTSWLGI